MPSHSSQNKLTIITLLVLESLCQKTEKTFKLNGESTSSHEAILQDLLRSVELVVSLSDAVGVTLRDVGRHGMRPCGGETASISLIPSSLLRCTRRQLLHAVSSVYVVHPTAVSRLHLVLELVRCSKVSGLHLLTIRSMQGATGRERG